MPRGPLKEIFSRAKSVNSNFGKNTVLDVGANEGQSFTRLRRLLPEARIHCFEPVPTTFSKLVKLTNGDQLAFAHQMGLASKDGVVRFTSGLNSGNHQILNSDQPVLNEIEVKVSTGDGICKDLEIQKIDYLKVDAEGYDLDILVGFSDMLRSKRIKFLQVECTTSLDNRFHVHLERFIHFLHPFNYRLCDLIEPVRRVNKTKQSLNGIWYCNAVFAREVDYPRIRKDGVN